MLSPLTRHLRTKGTLAVEIEKFVVDRLRTIGRDPALVAATVEEARKQLGARRAELGAEAKRIQGTSTGHMLISEARSRRFQVRDVDAATSRKRRSVDSRGGLPPCVRSLPF